MATKQKNFFAPKHLDGVEGIKTDDGSIDSLYVEKELEIEAGGTLGIGVSEPAEPLHIVGTANGGLEIETTSGAPSVIFDVPGNEQARLYFKEDAALAGSIVYDFSGHKLVFSGKGTHAEMARFDNSGNLGIGTASPARKLHINDVMRLEPATEPSSPSAGDVYYDSTSNKLRCHNGTTWNDLF